MSRELKIKQAIEGTSFTRGVTPEQINRRNGGMARHAVISRVMDEESRTVELAFSSEEPVERWFGLEVLSHEPGAMRTDRLENSAAVLFNHDPDDQIGVVQSMEIGPDKKGRARVRFGRSARASEFWQDVVDGIRRHVSVGYIVHKVKIEDRAGEPDLVTVVDWEPFEISIVSIPADVTVGVGRSADRALENPPGDQAPPSPDTQATNGNPDGNRPQMHEKILRDAQGNLVRAIVDDAGNIVEVLETIERAGEATRAGTEAERGRVRAIMEMGRQYNAADLAQQAVTADTSVADFQRSLLDHLHANGSGPLRDQRSDDIGMSERDVQNFSFMRALRALAEPTNRRYQEAAGFEYEASRAAADRMGREAQGIMVPPDVLRRALNTSTSGTADGDTGGYSIDTTLMSSSFVEILRNRSVLMQLGSPMGGLVGNIAIPKQASGATGYWIGEDDDAPEDGLEIGQIGMSPKTVAALSEITRNLLMQSSLDVEARVRADLAAALALTVDKAGFYGAGSGNKPKGIANYTGINGVVLAAAGKPTYAEVVEMESAIAADNADVNSMAYVLASTMRGHLKTSQKFAGTDGSPIWETGNTVNGYRTEVSNQIAAGDLFYGNFADLLIGMWGGLDLTVDPYTHSAKGRLRIVAMQSTDFVLRREESFCLARAA